MGFFFTYCAIAFDVLPAIGARFHPAIFAETQITFWELLRYALDLTIIGFLGDFLDYAKIEPLPTPVGIMYHAVFAIKLIMAATIVDSFYEYQNVSDGQIGFFDM